MVIVIVIEGTRPFPRGHISREAGHWRDRGGGGAGGGGGAWVWVLFRWVFGGGGSVGGGGAGGGVVGGRWVGGGGGGEKCLDLGDTSCIGWKAYGGL